MNISSWLHKYITMMLESNDDLMILLIAGLIVVFSALGIYYACILNASNVNTIKGNNVSILDMMADETTHVNTVNSVNSVDLSKFIPVPNHSGPVANCPSCVYTDPVPCQRRKFRRHKRYKPPPVTFETP